MNTQRSVLLVVLAVSALALTPGCLPNIDLTKALSVRDVTTGWFDAGIVPGPEGEQNKLVPSISFVLANTGSIPVASVQINAVFKRVGEEDEWGSDWVKGIGPEGLNPGAATQPIVLRCPLGYTGLQPRAQMLQNKTFVDARVTVFGKYGSATWVKLGEYTIQRQLLVR
jgi:hypothetical protein